MPRTTVERLLDMPSCITAVEDAFRRRAEGFPAPSAVLGVHVEGGGFHAKAAMLTLGQPWFVAKVNANFPANPATHGLPTIQGVLVLFDASRGVPLAVMDSVAITTIRTAAASAVAARHLARAGASTATIIGCGVQGRAHVAALRAVLPIARIVALDRDPSVADAFAVAMRARHGIEVLVASALAQLPTSDIIVTCTSARSAFLDSTHVAPGTFLAAVGADNEHKQEIDPGVLRDGVIVVDDLDQCAAMGDLHHAIAAGVVTREDVRGTLGEIVAGLRPGRSRDDEVIVFDSTGVAIEDVAAAAVTYERAVREGAGLEIALAS